MKIHYKKQKVVESDCVFEIQGNNSNVFLKSKYNFCNATTYPHFAQFRDGKEIVTVFIEKYHDVSATIHRSESYSASDIPIRKFIEKQKGDVVEITREEFFEYYNRLTKINEHEQRD